MVFYFDVPFTLMFQPRIKCSFIYRLIHEFVQFVLLLMNGRIPPYDELLFSLCKIIVYFYVQFPSRDLLIPHPRNPHPVLLSIHPRNPRFRFTADPTPKGSGPTTASLVTKAYNVSTTKICTNTQLFFPLSHQSTTSASHTMVSLTY